MAQVTDSVQIVMAMNPSIRFEFLIQLMTWKEEYYKLRVDSFATYPYSCRICLLEFSLYFSLKTYNKNSSGQMRQLYAYVLADESTLDC